MKWKKAGVALLLSSAVVWSGCGLMQQEEEYHVMQVTAEDEEETVGTAVVLRGDLTLENDVLTSYEAEEESLLSFAVSGEKYAAIYAKEGDTVKKGELMAQLDCKDYVEQLENAQYELERIVVKQSELDVLFANYGISKADYDSQKADYANQKAVLEQRMKEYRVYIQERSIYADIDGIVAQMKPLDLTQRSEEGKVFYILQGGVQRFAAKTDYFPNMTVGQQFEMTVGADLYTVQLEAINDMEGESEKKHLVFTFPSNDFNPASGSTGRIHYMVEESTDVLYIPADSIRENDGKTYVYYISELGLRQAKEVQIEKYYKDFAIVADGLAEGEEIICE